jgi:hypothetical protein
MSRIQQQDLGPNASQEAWNPRFDAAGEIELRAR